VGRREKEKWERGVEGWGVRVGVSGEHGGAYTYTYLRGGDQRLSVARRDEVVHDAHQLLGLRLGLLRLRAKGLVGDGESQTMGKK
jgi:hypothetical protein